MELMDFKEEFISDAALLLAERHKSERLRFPKLSQRYENVEVCEELLHLIWEKDYTTGIAAFEKGELVGYIIGKINFNSKYFERHAWVNYEGVAIQDGQKYELYRKLYAEISKIWINNGCFNHYIQLPADDEDMIDSWLKLGFSYQQVHGLKEIKDVSKIELDNIEIRIAEEDDINEIKKLSKLNYYHQSKSPVWATAFPEDFEMLEEGYAEFVVNENTELWLAFKNNKLVGLLCYKMINTNKLDMMLPENSIEIICTGVIPEMRNKGIGTVLTKYALNNAKIRGFDHCITDWRITNLESSIFWPEKGFEEIAYRFERKIDPRISWADGNRKIGK